MPLVPQVLLDNLRQLERVITAYPDGDQEDVVRTEEDVAVAELDGQLTTALPPGSRRARPVAAQPDPTHTYAGAVSSQSPSHASRTDPSLESRYRRSKTLNVILGALVAFFAIVLVGQLTSTTNTASEPPAPGASPAATADASADEDLGIEQRDPDDPMAIGDVDAPVVMVQWTDLRCPYCAVFSRDTLPTIVEEYVDTGKVRIEVRDAAFFGEESVTAAVAARAAGKQGLYAEYLDAVYEAAPESGHPPLPEEELIDFAEQVKVPDLDQFRADLDDPELAAAVDESTQHAQGLGVNSVPFFVASETSLSGAQPIDVFRQYLDQAIDEAG